MGIVIIYTAKWLTILYLLFKYTKKMDRMDTFRHSQNICIFKLKLCARNI